MRLLLLLTVAVATMSGGLAAPSVKEAAVEVAEDAAVEAAKEVLYAQEIALVAVAKETQLMVTPISSETLEKVRQSLDAIQKFADIFASKAFENTKVGMIAEVLSKSLTFVIAMIDLFGGGETESAEMKFMREQFVEVNAKLDGINLQLEEVKELIEWQTTRVMYANLEIAISNSARLFDNYMKADSSSRDYRKRLFIESFRSDRFAAYKLYQGVVEKDFVIAQNLGAAVIHFTKNHRRKVLNFMLAMSRLILRGAHLEIAYEKLQYTDATAALLEADWKARMEKLARRMKEVDATVVSQFDVQMKKDANAFIIENRELTNQQFSNALYNFVAEKFYWREWIVIAYKDVTGFQNHAVSYCNGATFFRVVGNRNVVISSSDPETSSFNRNSALQDLAAVEAVNHNTNNAETWLNEINRRVTTACSRASFRAAICWGCDVWFTSKDSRRAYRKLQSRGYIVNAILFG